MGAGKLKEQMIRVLKRSELLSYRNKLGIKLHLINFCIAEVRCLESAIPREGMSTPHPVLPYFPLPFSVPLSLKHIYDGP